MSLARLVDRIGHHSSPAPGCAASRSLPTAVPAIAAAPHTMGGGSTGAATRRLGLLLQHASRGRGGADVFGGSGGGGGAEDNGDDTTTTTTFYIVRHGETQWNREGRLQGSVDTALNEAGLTQAAEAAQALASFPCDAVVSSPLQRTARTANAIRRYHPSAVYREYRGLAESNAGELQRRLHSELDVAAAMAECETQWRIGNGEHRYPGPLGESPAQVVRRARAALAEAAELGSNVIVACHGFVLKSLAWSALGCGWAEIPDHIPNCCVSTYKYNRHTRELRAVKLFEVVIRTPDALGDIQAGVPARFRGVEITAV
jgi:broad specificity phosphatase PhoE